jgi:amino acid efflux transporter
MSELQKHLGFYHGLALYLAAVLGTGILVVPLMAWTEGGPASLIAWVVLAVLGLALAWTFASVGAQKPDAGGVQAVVGRVYGRTVEAITRDLIFFTIPAGAVAGGHILGYHLCAAFSLPLSLVPLIAFAAWVLITIANCFGVRVSARAQLVMSSLLIALLLLFIFDGLPTVRPENLRPFAPRGALGVGRAAVVIFWSFLGWEAIAHLAEEFEDPRRDMLRAAVTAALVVGVLYFGVSFVLIGAGATGNPAQMAPLVSFAARAAGRGGRVFTGLLAVVICLGTMNAYMAGLSRLGYSMARSGDLPAALARLERDGTPRNSVLAQFALNSLALAVQWLFRIPLKMFFLVPNVSFLTLYILGCLAAARLLRGQTLAVAAAYAAAGVCALMLFFTSGAWLVPALVASLAFLRRSSRENAPLAVPGA